MAPAPTEAEIATVKATIPALKTHGVEIITRFYHVLFERYPSVMPQFNMDRHAGGAMKTEGVPAQVAALANAVLAYATHIDNVQAIMPVVVRICHKHVSRGVVAPQYDAVGECLLFAFKDVLGDACTDEITAAWASAYGALAQAFIDTEKQILKEVSSRAGYTGFKEMRVTKQDKTASGDISLAVVGADGSVVAHSPGQFVALRVKGPDGTLTMTTAFIDEECANELRLRLPGRGATNLSVAKITVGECIDVGMPCGAPKKE